MSERVVASFRGCRTQAEAFSILDAWRLEHAEAACRRHGAYLISIDASTEDIAEQLAQLRVHLTTYSSEARAQITAIFREMGLR